MRTWGTPLPAHQARLGRLTRSEKYLTQARLPWATAPNGDRTVTPAGTFDLSALPGSLEAQIGEGPHSLSELTASTRPRPTDDPASQSNPPDASIVATPGEPGAPSGTSTPRSAGFVSLASLRMVDGKLRKARLAASKIAGSSNSGASGQSTPVGGGGGSPDVVSSPRKVKAEGEDKDGEGGEEVEDEEEGGLDDDDDDVPVYLKWDEEKGLDPDKYAVLPNDWPYNVPHGVRHFCVWSRVRLSPLYITMGCGSTQAHTHAHTLTAGPDRPPDVGGVRPGRVGQDRAGRARWVHGCDTLTTVQTLCPAFQPRYFDCQPEPAGQSVRQRRAGQVHRQPARTGLVRCRRGVCRGGDAPMGRGRV